MGKLAFLARGPPKAEIGCNQSNFHARYLNFVSLNWRWRLVAAMTAVEAASTTTTLRPAPECLPGLHTNRWGPTEHDQTFMSPAFLWFAWPRAQLRPVAPATTSRGHRGASSKHSKPGHRLHADLWRMRPNLVANGEHVPEWVSLCPAPQQYKR